MASENTASFLVRNEFLIRRLHSLAGLVPVGAYMVVHLLTNASVLNGPQSFQNAVYGIHSLGALLLPVEWVFIFIPILFHAILGVVIIAGGIPNTQAYPYSGNVRYVLQRATGMIAFVFIVWHVFHMHGWFHNEWWLTNVARPLGGAEFAPYNAASTLGAAFQGPAAAIVIGLYVIGLLSCVFHLANGIWTMGITWGVWVSEDAQKRATKVCAAFGVLIAAVGLSALFGAATVNVKEAREDENLWYEKRVEAGEVLPDEHKRAIEHSGEHQTAERGHGEIESPAPTAPSESSASNEDAAAPATDQETETQ